MRMLPSNPSSRRVSAAVAPAKPPPMIRKLSILLSVQSELCPVRALVLQFSAEGGGHRCRAGRLHAAQRHAQVLGFHYDSDPARAELAREPVGDLPGESLLHLQVTTEVLDHSRDLGKAEQAVARQ